MIKKITKLLHPKLINKNQIVYFKTGQPGEQEELLADENIEELKEEFEKKKKQPLQSEEVQQEIIQAEAGQQHHKKKKARDNDFQNLQLYDSNWEFLSRFVNMEHTFSKKGQDYYNTVNQQLSKLESFVDFDLQNLSRLHINQLSEFQIKRSILRNNSEYRYLETDAEHGLPLQSALISRSKLLELIESKNQVALRRMFKNGQVTNKNGLMYEDMHIIVNKVIQSNFKNSFLLNFLNFSQYIQKTRKGTSNPKQIQKIWQRLDLLVDVNKLSTLWAVKKLFLQDPTNPHETAISNAIISQLPKIGFNGLDSFQTEKEIRLLFSNKVHSQTIIKLLKYSIQTFTQYQNFISFWALSILLYSKLYSFNCSHSNFSSISLNKQFTLFQNNLKQHYQNILFTIIPEQLHKSNQKIVLELYKVNLKNWRAGSQISQKKKDNFFSTFVQKSIQTEKPIQIVYASWRNSFPQKIQSKLYLTSKKAFQKYSTAISEEQMIKSLVKGDYSSVLNYFLLTFNPSFDKTTYTQIKKIIIQSKQYEFQDQNAKSYFILSKISDLLSYQAKPKALQPKYFQKFKEIKWMNYRSDLQERKKTQHGKLFSSSTSLKIKEKRYNEEEDDEFKGYSRKRAQNLYQNPVSAQRIYRKPKLFNRNKQQFSTTSPNSTNTNNIQGEITPQLKDSYSEYKQTVKQLTNQTSSLQFSFNEYKDLKSIQQYAEKKSSQINQFNYKFLSNKNNIPIVGQGNNLLKFLFLKGKGQGMQSSNQFQKIKNRLKVSFVSQIGGLEKDYSQYLSDCRFMFPLSDAIYTDLLLDQALNYSRKNFKTIVSHIVAFKNSISENQMALICQICQKNKTGITLVEIYFLFINNKIQMPVPSIYKICDALQRFKKINNDVFPLTKKYCQNLKIPFQIKMMSSYCKSLLQQMEKENQTKLIEFCQILKDELRPKPYKVRTDLTAEQNLKIQKQYKEASRVTYIKILFEIIHMVVSNVDKKLPVFISDLFDQYEKLKTNLQPYEIAVSLMVYSGNVPKFLQIIGSLRQNPKNIIVDSYDWAIKAMILNPRSFEQYIQNCFETLLFTHNFILTQDQVSRTALLFKLLKGPTVFSRFLNFIIRFKIPVNHEIKNIFYFTMNNSNDDLSKSSINQLLDLIFNPNRQKQKQKFRQQKIAEEDKSKLIQEIQNKSSAKYKKIKQQENAQNDKKQKSADGKKGNTTTNVNNTKKVDEVENSTQGKKEPQGKKIENKTKKQLSKQNKVKPQRKGSRLQRSKLLSQHKQGMIVDVKDQKQEDILKANVLPKKLQSTSLSNFTDIFGSKDPIEETAKGKNVTRGKGVLATSRKDEINAAKDGKTGAIKSSYNPAKANKKK